jgi:predicted ATPase
LSEHANRFFAITGGPGSGKTTLLSALEASGQFCLPEAGRAIIQAQVAIGGSALPWSDPGAFAELMLSWEIRSHQMAEAADGLAFFDRGVPDVAGYFRLTGLPVPAHVEKAVEIYRYNRTVFIAPPWPKIFTQDRERKQDFGEAVRTYDALVATYSASGYELIELPRAPVEERAAFVLRTVAALS